MATPGRRKRTLFYLISIILPSLLLVVFALRLIRQDKELAVKRTEEERRARAVEIGRRLLAVLEESKNRIKDRAGPPYELPVVLVGWIRGEELILPWEDSSSPGHNAESLKAEAFAAKLRPAERAEFAEKNPARAAGLYRSLLASALDPTQAAFVRLSLARALYGAGRNEEAREIDRSLLVLGPEIGDEFQIPFAFYAAERLADSPPDREGILTALTRPAIPWIRMAPGAVLRGRDLLNRLEKSLNPEVGKKASSTLALISETLKTQAQAEALQKEFRSLGLAEDKEFVLFGDNPWIVSLRTTAAGGSFFVAFDARLALEKISAPGTRIVGLQDPGGLPLSPALANARLLLPASPAGGPSASSPDSRSSLYLLIVALALGIMTFGSYLFWRDVRRDLETAEMRSQFVASVSHELKTPLAAIRMFADTLRLGRLRDPEKREEYLETIANESQRLDRLLSNVLDVAKIEKGQRVYRFEKTSLRGVIETAVRAMDYPLRQKGFELRLNLVDGIPDLSADRDALVQAVLNLLDNAVKYSGEARLIDIVLEREGAAAVIRVVDRGIGVPEAERKRIFEKFYRAPDPRNEGVVGAGLGLALAAHIVEAHRGRIEVRSRPGEETVFSIHLPLENGG